MPKGGGTRTQNMPALFLLHEDNNPQTSSIPPSVQFYRRLRREDLSAVFAREADRSQLAQHRRVMQIFARVFAARYGGMKASLGDRQEDFGGIPRR